MEKVKIFENSVKRMNEITAMAASDEDREKAYDELYNGLPGLKANLFDKYRDAMRRANEHMNWDDLPDVGEIPGFVACLRECGVKHVTVSSRWSGLVERLWALTQNGCVVEGMVEINARVKNLATGEYEKEPAFLLAVERGKKARIF